MCTGGGDATLLAPSPSTATIASPITAPRDASSGLATGQRSH
jgi:hypothetical protein